MGGGKMLLGGHYVMVKKLGDVRMIPRMVTQFSRKLNKLVFAGYDIKSNEEIVVKLEKRNHVTMPNLHYEAQVYS